MGFDVRVCCKHCCLPSTVSQAPFPTPQATQLFVSYLVEGIFCSVPSVLVFNDVGLVQERFVPTRDTASEGGGICAEGEQGKEGPKEEDGDVGRHAGDENGAPLCWKLGEGGRASVLSVSPLPVVLV